MSFENLAGQEKVKNFLTEAAVSGRLGHAYLFVGPEGIGKKTFCDEFVKLIMCTGRGEKEKTPCRACESCRLLEQGFNPDRIEGDVPEGKATIPVETVRQIQENITTAPAYGRKKVIVIRRADKMTAQAQNALLKTLEEPPEYVVMILLAENKNLMLETVKSRVVTVEFSRNTDAEIEEFFLKTYGSDKKDKLPLVLAYCDGIIGRVHQIGDGKESEKIRNEIPEIIGKIQSDRYSASKKLQEMIKKYESYGSFVFFTMRSFYRDVQIVARYGTKAQLMNPDYKEKIAELAQKIGYRKAGYDCDIVDETWKMLGRNANMKLAIDRMVIFLQ